jgi:hypothetical protein
MIKVNQTVIPALRYNNLVYVRNLKCASTFFYENLLNVLGWKKTSYDDINWELDHVFGHLIDPVERRHKGVAEFIDMCGLTDKFVNDDQLQSLLRATPFLDRHAVSYTNIFKEKCYSIDWIPLVSSAHNDNILNTQKLLKYYGHNIAMADWDLTYVHPGDPLKKQAETILRKNWIDAITSPNSRLTNNVTECEFEYLKLDIALYTQVLEKFSPTFNAWNEVSWLKK